MSKEANATAPQTFEVPVRDAEGKELERVRIDSSRIDIRVRPRLLKEAVLMYQANKRVGTHDTKIRGEVAGSNKKPWRQKGTGRARAGTRKSPLWRGGGIIFGPHPRDYSYALPKKMLARALRSALFAKFRDGEVMVVDGLKVEKPRTRTVAALLKSLGIEGSCLIGTAGPSPDRNLVLSVRNLPKVKIAPVGEFNALDVLKAKMILLTREALDQFLGNLNPSASVVPSVDGPSAPAAGTAGPSPAQELREGYPVAGDAPGDAQPPAESASESEVKS